RFLIICGNVNVKIITNISYIMKNKLCRLFLFFSDQIPKACCMRVRVSCLFFLLWNCGFSPVLLANVATTISIDQNVQGIVKDKEGKPLEGATVIIKGTSVGTQTDRYGEFTFPNLEKGSVLVVTYTGYLTKEITLVDQVRIDIMLEEDPEALEEVVVVAFGTQKKTDMVGAVTTVKPSDLRVPSSNLTTALAGQAAGIIAYQRSGEPGQDNADFFIRGVTSFGTGKVDPLILIDGVELGVTELARLRADDIESFSI